MIKSQKNLNVRKFDIIYVEKEAYGYEITADVLKRYPGAEIIMVKSYKDVFNRTKQHFGIQKLFHSLILAVKKDGFVYKGSDMCQNFGYENYCYSTLMLNCIYDCSYCFLQGMYNSANIVAFVNIKDFKNEFQNLPQKTYLALSYETDLIAFHGIIPYLNYLYDFFKANTHIVAEIRTKSANRVIYKMHKPLENLIIAFTLTPESIINKYEKYTPSLDARIKAVNTAMEEGYKVRICFDPVFADEPGDVYEAFYNDIFNKIDTQKIYDAGYGFFRMPKEYYSRICKTNDSIIYAGDYEDNGYSITYPERLRESVMRKHICIIQNYIDREKIY